MEDSSSHPPHMSFDVFLSFTWQNKRFARLLCRDLRTRLGITVFMEDKKLPLIEDDFSENVVKEIEGSGCSIVDYLSENVVKAIVGSRCSAVDNLSENTVKAIEGSGCSVVDDLSENTVKAIEGSRCSVVVLSKGYASSKSCLRELAKIIDHMDNTTHQVLPVFYCVQPIHARNQSGNFKKIFEEYEESTQQLMDNEQKEKHLKEIQRWRDAMTKICNLSGGVVEAKYGNELTSIMSLIKQISDMLNLVAQNRYLVEMPLRLDRMNMLLGLETDDDVRIIGIVGMGGVGKTTIAEIFYEKFAPKFSKSCFLRVATGCNLVSLQQQLLSQLLLRNDKEILHESDGVTTIMHHLNYERVLIVLDGIDDKRQLEMLAGSPTWFHPKSRVIITTRNKDILRHHNYKDKVQEYNVELLHDTSAYSLLCKYAFGDDEPPDENFKDLCIEIIEKVGRLPLALIKIGSSLYGQSMDVWEETLKSYHKLVHENLFFDILKTSYEGLKVYSQQIFLDCACFFNGEKVDRVVEILKGFGYSSPDTKLQLLVDRCLIDVSDERIQMHILILCMGQGIVHGELATQQGKQSRIWLREDARCVFHKKNGLKYIQGIVMDLEEEEELVVEAKSFTDMTELKILQINNVQLSEDIEFLSNQLVLLNWPGYPSKCLPSTFQAPPLLELHLLGSNLERLWEGKKKFEKLKEIDVSESEYLVETPDFSEVPNLRRLILWNCRKLYAVHPSINSLQHLVLLDLESCISLRSFSSNYISCKSLKTLILSNSGLEYFPEVGGPMDRLTELHLEGTIINQLPLSITHLTSLVLLNLRNCARLSSLPSEMGGLSNLKTLILNGCKNLNEIPPSLWDVKSLEELDIGRTSISQAPRAIPFLWNLRILNCEGLKSNIWHSLAALSGDFGSLRDLNLSDCNLLDESIPNDLHCFSSLEILDLSSNQFVELPESLDQLISLKALYLTDCNELQKLPSLPASLLLVGADKSLDMLRNSQGSSANASSSSPSSLVDNLLKEAELYKRSPEVDIVNNMGKQCFEFAASSKTLVGMENQLEKVCNLLDLERSNDILLVGIFGIGGIGKTSIAEVVYDTVADKFQKSCFLHLSKQTNLVTLQHQMLSQLLSKEIQIWDEDYGAQTIKDHMSNTKVVIVLDGADETRQIEKLAGSSDWFGPGSRVIVTSRNRDILHQPNWKDKMQLQEYNMELLSGESAYSLFCKHAFGDGLPDKNDDLCNEIVEKVGRLPLALRTIGSFLHKKDLVVWEDTLMRLGKVEEDFFDTILQRSRRRNFHQGACQANR